ncbi:hypothetical protein N9W17_01485 [Jannaschia sp.]|nr:hypothetical protein [Jannaschia sp.]
MIQTETVDFVVVEAGVHQLTNGATIEAGLVTASRVQQSTLREGFESVSLEGDFSGEVNAFATARIDTLNENGFRIAIAEQEPKTDGHQAEDIGFLVVQGGEFGDFRTDQFEFNQNRTAVELDVDLAQIVDVRRGDSAVVRHDTDTGEVFVREDKTEDTELAHNADLVSLIDFAQEDGFLFV